VSITPESIHIRGITAIPIPLAQTKVQVGENRLTLFYSEKAQRNTISDSAIENKRKTLQKQFTPLTIRLHE
jgi:hypothetical protein